jgi:hypothetical protein
VRAHHFLQNVNDPGEAAAPPFGVCPVPPARIDLTTQPSLGKLFFQLKDDRFSEKIQREDYDYWERAVL